MCSHLHILLFALRLSAFGIDCVASPASAMNAGISGWVFKNLFGWMDIPDSLCEVVLSFCLLVVTHTGLRQLVSILADELDLPEPPKAERGPDRVADDDGPDGTRYRFCSHTIGFYMSLGCQ